MKRGSVTVAVAATLLTLVMPVVQAADEQPSDTQFDVAGYFSSLSLGPDGGSVSTAFKPVPETVRSTQDSFAVWLATLHTDDPSVQNLMVELALLCGQDQPDDFSFATAVCTTPDAVDDILDQPEPPAVVVVEREKGWNLGLSFQLTLIGTDVSRDVYDGPEGDPNTGHNTSFDLYWAGSGLALGLTTYDAGSFDFVPFESGIAIVKNPGWIAYLLPGQLFDQLQDPEAWINDGGWDQTPIPVGMSQLLFGPQEFVTSSLTESPGTEAEPTEEPPPEEEPATQPETEEEPARAEEPEPAGETPEVAVAEPDSEGLPVAAVVAGGVAVAAAAAVGLVVASRRRRGKCDELLEDYDMAYGKWAEASRAMNQARDAYSLGDTAGTEGARAAQEAAERAEREAYDAERSAWNNYLNCTGEARTAARTAPVRNEPAQVTVQGGDVIGVGAAVAGVSVDPSPDETATAPPPEKPVPCTENEVKDLEVLETLRGSLTLAYTIVSGTEGIRSTREEAGEMVRDLNEVGDQISEINDAIQEGGGGAGAVIADAAATVLELTARLGAGAAAAASQMLEGHRVYNFTYEEHRVVVDMRWVKFLRCVQGSWRCFYDLEVKDFHRITIPQTEEFHGDREAREARLKVFTNKGKNAVARDRPKFESFMAAHEVGPC